MNTNQLLSQYLEYNIPNTDSSVIQWNELYVPAVLCFLRLDSSFRARVLRSHTIPATLDYRDGVLSYTGKESQWVTSLFVPPCRNETVTLRFYYSSTHSAGQLIIGFAESSASRCTLFSFLLLQRH